MDAFVTLNEPIPNNAIVMNSKGINNGWAISIKCQPQLCAARRRPPAWHCFQTHPAGRRPRRGGPWAQAGVGMVRSVPPQGDAAEGQGTSVAPARPCSGITPRMATPEPLGRQERGR